jgi:hypothetical protein
MQHILTSTSSYHIFQGHVYAEIHKFLLSLGMHIKFINHFALFCSTTPFYHQAGVGKARLIIGKNIILFVKKRFHIFRADFFPATSDFEIENISKLTLYKYIISLFKLGVDFTASNEWQVR